MKTKKIAIITFYHTEVSLCLAKYLGLQHATNVDCYIIVDYLRDKGRRPGLNYQKASKVLGIHKLTESESTDIFKWKRDSNLNIFLLRVFSFSEKFKWLYKIIIRWSIKRIIKNKYDAINLIGQTPWIEYIHDLLKTENLTHTLHEIGSDHNGILATPYINKLINDRSKIIFHSKFLEKKFRLIDISNSCIIQSIPFGIFETIKLDSDYTMPIEIDSNKITFLFYGMIKPYKGLSLLRKAIEELGDACKEFNLIIAGSGYDESLNYFKNRENVYLINRYILDSEMAYLNRISDIVLLPYKSASQSGIVPNSFMFGNPVIATKVGALPEYIEDGVNGLLVEEGDYKSFANAMCLLIKDNKLLRKLQYGAHNFGNKDQYDWNNISKTTLDFLYK